MRFERHHSALILSSLFTVASFIAATAYTQSRFVRLDALSSAIETNAVPSIDYLSRAGVRLARLNQLLDDISAEGPKRASARDAARQELLALDQEVNAYLQLPPLPGERDFWAALRADVSRAAQLVGQSIEGEEQLPQSDGVDAERVDAALDRALHSVLVTLDFDVRQSEDMARDVRHIRATMLRTVVLLDAGATIVALFGLLIAYRVSRSHDELLREHNSLLAARVAELDRFAGRVAHDVLSPMGTIATGLSLLSRVTDNRGHTAIERSQRALQRVQHLVDDLLMFARSGARPDPGVSCSVDAVLKNVVADSAELAADAGIALRLDGDEPLQVACSVGVMTSIVQNLVRNAIKYMGDQPIRRIIVRAKRVGSIVRLEVEDTGPGIAADLQCAIFAAFVRGPNERVGGTGLGLAIVKRLAESHGGTVGVQSTVGVGSVFWVELPLANVSSTAISRTL
jgi:signal transduction histidine kinase